MLLILKDQMLILKNRYGIGDIEEPPFQSQRFVTSTKASSFRIQETNSKPPAKQFFQRLGRKANQKSEKEIGSDSYYSDDQYALESATWQNDTSDSQSDWKRLSKSNGVDIDLWNDASDWKL